jgi:hypothetical protein
MSDSKNDSAIVHFKTVLLDSRRYHVAFLLLFVLLTRISVFFHIETVTLGWRQADLSSVAMNYLHNGFRFLYPQIDWGGAGPGYVEMEFPIIPYITAIFFKVFGIHDIWTMVIPFLCGIGVVVAIYKLTERLYNSSFALVAALFAGSSPLLWLASQTFLGEPALILCSILSIHYLLRWSDTDRARDYVFSVVFTSLAALLKLTALYIGLPILIVFIVKYGRGVLKQMQFWLFGVLSLLPVVLWYFHAHSLYVEYGNTFGILSGGYNKFARAELLLSPDFYVLMAKRILLSVSTPIVVLLFGYGLFKRPAKQAAYLLHAWAAALVVYTLLIAEGNKDMIYYQLPWLPALAMLGSVGLFSVFKLMEGSPLLSGRMRHQRSALVLMCTLVALSVVAVGVRAMRVPITFLESEAQIRNYAEEVRGITPEGSLIIVATSYGNEKTPETIDTPPQMFYFSSRHGWYLALAWVDVAAIESLRGQGANYLVVFNGDVGNLRSNKMLYHHLESRYSPIVNRNDLVVFQLTPKKAS